MFVFLRDSSRVSVSKQKIYCEPLSFVYIFCVWSFFCLFFCGDNSWTWTVNRSLSFSLLFTWVLLLIYLYFSSSCFCIYLCIFYFFLVKRVIVVLIVVSLILKTFQNYEHSQTFVFACDLFQSTFSTWFTPRPRRYNIKNNYLTARGSRRFNEN